MFPQIPALIDHAVQHFQKGDHPKAAELLGKVLDAQPRNFDALHILGVIRALQGNRAEAIELFQKALSVNKRNNFLHFNLAKALSESDRDAEALVHHRKATQLAPNHAEAWLNFGKSLANLHRHEDAIDAYNKALAINPLFAEAWNNKGTALKQLNREADALASCDEALKINPALAEAHNSKGLILAGMDQPEAALACYDRATELKPDYTDAYNSKGITLAGLGQFQAALACYDRAIELRADYAEAYTNKGLTLADLGHDDAAMTCYQQAIARQPEYIDVHWNQSLLLLKNGHYADGWFKFEYRWQVKEFNSKRVETKKPLWRGQPSNQPLLLWAEQGVGDQILYASILPEIAAFPQKKYVALDKRLIPLFARSMPGFEFVDLVHVSDALDFAEHLPIGSLPRYFRKSRESFDAAHYPFLIADPARSVALREKTHHTGKLTCGISWSSNRKDIGSHKSISLEQMLLPLASDQLSFVNLQYGDTTVERNDLQARHGIVVQNVDEMDNFNDIDGLAALVQACDVVITTSNTTAHLAGALGKATLLLLPLGRSRLWYWEEQEGKNPWYPSIKMFTQAKPGQWQQPLELIRAHLENISWN